MSKDSVGILLAAGGSRRFGVNKLHQQLANGVPMALQAAQNLIAVLPDCVAVVRPDAATLPSRLHEIGFRIVVNDHADAGIGSSLAAGISAATDASGWLIALADMPFIPPAIIQRLVDELRAGRSIVAPFYHGRRGHPVGFAAKYGPALMALAGDQGARAIIDSHIHELSMLAVDSECVLVDIDQPSDLNRFPPIQQL